MASPISSSNSASTSGPPAALAAAATPPGPEAARPPEDEASTGPPDVLPAFAKIACLISLGSLDWVRNFCNVDPAGFKSDLKTLSKILSSWPGQMWSLFDVILTAFSKMV
eukprot:4496965-Pyramimonas_sp.AAC.1